ncbi:hypothetical protein [Caldovatus aquaticus]|jgi:hypothetical protein|uniref:Uncharacterized protein n=1 Tax=Caldovatus aquaticus TaxID=2865671 RepID=A0ABS7F641_9PROT|nr:hypothetical protein [Caldovatus aquaticus]MBW8271085.1 hypothetical protein [Caldovatus aquaticus]
MPNATAAPAAPRRRGAFRAPLALAAAALLGLAGCDGEGLMAGGEYSGVPDTPITVGRNELAPYGYMRTDGTIVLNRETGDYRDFPRR